MILYQYPPSTVLNRVITKNRLYEQGNANSKLKQRFVDDVEKIVWAYKLSADTLNIEAQGQLQEVQIFRIVARGTDVDISIIKYIDKLIATPVIFEIVRDDNVQDSKIKKVKVIASYKRVSQADKSKTVLNKYYASSWQADDNRAPLPFVLSLSDLYTHLIEQLLPDITMPSVATSATLKDKTSDEDKPSHDKRSPINQHANQQALPNENTAIQSVKNSKPVDAKVDIEAKLKHVQQVESLQKQISQLQKKVSKEAQFNRQVKLNMQLYKLKNQLNQLISEP